MNLIFRLIIGLSLVSSYGSTIFAQEIECLFLGDNAGHQPRLRFAELQPAMLERGIKLTYTDQVGDLNAETLAKYDALVLYANIDELADEPASALFEYVDKGGAFVPLHCASYCFRNRPKLVALIGAQFKSHGTGVFQAEVAKTDHPITSGYGGFKSWDETYVHHLHNDEHRTILEYRFGETGREPWTWVRTQGQGRVFYTAWGHDSRTWTNPGFQNLVERGIRWVVKKDPLVAGAFLANKPFPVPAMKPMPKDLKPFEYVDVGNQIPNYTPSKKWGVQGKPLNMMQKPLVPAESMKHIVVPEGFHVELFASEPDLDGKPICMTWDERGRLWIGETLDYPNELKPPGEGRDRIRICEDTDQDGVADKFTVFAEHLSVPTSMAFHRGGVIVQNGIETLYLKDTDGDDIADEREVLVTGWNLGDTHGGVSNFQYGLDNWIWAMQGYNDSKPKADDHDPVRFRQGFFRFRPDGSEVEFIRSTNNNTWGLGISEEGIIFGSTANGCPSVYMPIPNRYYERVLGWTPLLTLESMADSNKFAPITDKVRQVDWHGGYTAGAGHALYTAREYPQDYWNRVAFVNGPTGHLVGAFVINGRGSDYNSMSPFNLLASNDEWTAPIMSEVGPDGQMWVIDWYNYIVQHNPTPQGFETGKGAAYETELRDKKHGRIYRVVADTSEDNQNGSKYTNLGNATPAELVTALSHPTMLVRKHAQRLLVERDNPDVGDALIERVHNPQLDEIGLDVGAIHSLWTLHGLGLLDGTNQQANEAVIGALQHPSAGVRRNAVQVLPHDSALVAELIHAKLHRDRDFQVRLAAILAISDRTTDNEAAASALVIVLTSPTDMAQRWIRDALMSAAAVNSEPFLSGLGNVSSLPESSQAIVASVAEHHARSENAGTSADLLASLSDAQPDVIEAVLRGLSAGWKSDRNLKVGMSDTTEAKLQQVFQRISPSSKGTLVTLATIWGSEKFVQYSQEIASGFLKTVSDVDASDADRIRAAEELAAFLPDDDNVIEDLLDELTLQTPPQVALGLIRAVGNSRSRGVGSALVSRLTSLTPDLKRAAYLELLKRPASTTALLDGADAGEVSLDELDLDQKESLMSHPNAEIKTRATKLLSLGGSLPNADRQAVIEEYEVATQSSGDAAAGKLLYTTHCAKCHVHGDEGVEIGPNLTGMAVHPKEELLIHILDPSRSVEANFRAYKALTDEGLFVTGMLASESKTSIEMVDTLGNRISLLREDLEELTMSKKSVMPDGFEKSLTPEAMTDLLEFLTLKGQFLPLPIERVATAVSTRGLFSDTNNGPDRVIFEDWKPKTFRGVPFVVVDPQHGKRPNMIVLHGPNHPRSSKYPKSVTIPVNTPVHAIHILGGVGGWNYPFDRNETVSAIVRLHYVGGETEDHELNNGRHIADYIRRVDVPESEFAFDLGGQQLRYLTITPKQAKSIESIEFVKGPDRSSPIFMAVTVELREEKAGK